MRISLGKHHIAYQEKGKSEKTLVFIHGGGCSLRQWSLQENHLSTHFRTIALDLPGHGDSTCEVESSYEYEKITEVLLTFITKKNLSEVVFIGHSLGASLCLDLASKCQETSHIILVDPTIDVSRTPKEVLEPFLESMEKDQQAALLQNAESYLTDSDLKIRDLVYTDIRRTQKRAVYQCLESLKRFDPVATFEKIDSPVDCLISSYNKLPFSLPNVIKQLDPIEIPDVSHWLQLEAPDIVNKHLLNFLRTPAS